MSGTGAHPIADALDNPQPAPDMARPGDAGTERAKYERPPFPSGCPVKALGINQDITGSQKCYYLNFNRQLVALEANNKHGKLGLIALFGPQSDWLEDNFPQWSAPQFEGRGKERIMVKQPEIVGFDQADAARALIEECVRKGVFDPAGKMRGRGAHRLPNGQGMALHCGDKLLVAEHKVDGAIKGWRWIDVGLHEGFVYHAAPATPRPHHEPAGAAAAIRLIELLRTWKWRRPLVDVRFVLGAIGASFIGGWLPWRPNVWITGGRGTGKSTLNGDHGVLPQLFGDGVFRTADASAAAIRQTLKNSTLPVLFDEIEAAEDNRRAIEVVQLARVASSGGSVTRGGQDHQAHEFTLRSCFWFSSINIPPLQPQDRSRLALLELDRFPAHSTPPVLHQWNLPQLGRELARRMVDGLHRVEATKAKYHAALAASGHDSRACDQFGTLLACADVLLHDWDTADRLPDDEEVNHWASACRPDRMAEVSEGVADEAACLNHITTTMVQARGGDEREMVGSWIGRAVAAAQLPLYDAESTLPADDRSGARLQQLGLKLVNARHHPETIEDGKVRPARWGAVEFAATEPGFLAVAGSHQALGEIFKGTKWQGGVWKQSLARTEGCLEGIKVKFARLSLRAVLVPLCEVLDDDELPEASRPAAAQAWLDAQATGVEA